MALRVRKLWPTTILNETHPKVLYSALARQQYGFGPSMIAWLRNQFDRPVEIPNTLNEHEWDALISAWATWKGLSGQWQIDLMGLAGNLLYPAGKVRYYWPE